MDLTAPYEAIMQFVSSAHWDDAGEAACESVFDLGLGDLVMDFLDEGP